MNAIGIRQKLAQATTIPEIDVLLADGRKFGLTSAKTRRAWTSTANRRRAKITGAAPPPPIVEEAVVDVPKKHKVKKSKRLEQSQ